MTTTPTHSHGVRPDHYTWSKSVEGLDWDELSELYRIAPLGDKPPTALETVFTNSMFTVFVRTGDTLIGAGRALGDGLDCAYVADVAVRPDFQSRGLGSAIIRQLLEEAAGHKKTILYANPGTEGFYTKLGFHRMTTAMAIWHNPQQGIDNGLLAPMQRTATTSDT